MDEVCEVPAFETTSNDIKDILTSIKTIAIVGLSPKNERDSNKVARYLQQEGYNVIPVNPNHKEIIGLKSHSSISEVTEKIDVVDIFRKPSAVPGIVDESIGKKVKVVWMQEGVINNEGAERAIGAGLTVVMNRCMKKEHMKMLKREGK